MANYPEFESKFAILRVPAALCNNFSIACPANRTDRRRSQDGSASNEQRPIAGSVGDGTKAV